MSAGAVALAFVVLAAGCGSGGGKAGSDPGTEVGTSSGGTSSGTSGSGSSSSGGTSSGATSSGGSSGSPTTGTEVCRIGTLGFAGQWGAGNLFTDWLTAKSSQGTSSLGDTVLTAELLAPLQVIVVQDVREGSAGQSGIGKGLGRAYTDAEVQVLRDWVAAGGGLMTLMGYADPSEISNVNRLLAPFGLSYGSTQVLFGSGGTTPVTHWADHPIATGVTRVGANNGYAVLGAGTLIAWEPTPGSVDAGRALESGKGRVFAWADEWITYNSEWTGHPDYQVALFWSNTLTWLSSSFGCQVPVPPSGEW